VALPDDCYQGVVGLATAGQKRGRWTVHRLAVADTAGWIEICGVADLIWLESPSNPLLTVADLDAICAAPRKRGAMLGVDNTFATPLNQRPLALGADVAVQSVTKFIGGHSDLLGGVVTVRDANLRQALRQSRELAGATPGTLETFLAVRGANHEIQRREIRVPGSDLLIRADGLIQAALIAHHVGRCDLRLDIRRESAWGEAWGVLVAEMVAGADEAVAQEHEQRLAA